jgi:uncharacterized repeat protein (TIGR03847 family)
MDGMPRRLFIFDSPDRFVPGTVGVPGNRTFFLQARKGRAVVTVALEKAQVSALADRMSELLMVVDEDGPLAVLAGGPAHEATPAEAEHPLDEPVVEAFRVGAMALSWDADAERVVIEAQPQDESGEYVEADDDAEEGPDVMRVRIEPDDARTFVRRARSLVASGRPPCPFCGEPLEPTGHFCVQQSGLLN